MTKFVSGLTLVFLGLVTLSAVAPGLAQLARAGMPLVLVVGIVAAVLRLVWFHTRRW